MTRRWSALGIAIILLASAVARGESETGTPAEPAVQPGKVEPPRLQARSQAVADQVSRCYSRFARRTSQMGRVVARVNVAPDGSATVASLPPGIEPWQEQTARCVVQALPFEPGTRDGVPVAAEVEMPIAFMIEGVEEVTYLSVATSQEEIERALRHCYPADAISIGTPKFRVAVNSQGRAVKIALVESSGDASLDEAGACVLESISFQPTKQGDQPVSSSAIIPVTIRPPKQAATRAPQPQGSLLREVDGAHAPDRVPHVIGDEQCAVPGNHHAHRPAPGIAVGVDEARQHVARRPGWLAPAERNEDHPVARKRLAIPRAVLAHEHAHRESRAEACAVR